MSMWGSLLKQTVSAGKFHLLFCTVNSCCFLKGVFVVRYGSLVTVKVMHIIIIIVIIIMPPAMGDIK